MLTASEVKALCQRADDLALGRIVNANVQMQLDTGGIYEDLPGAVAAFDEGTTAYRKIQGLEADEHFLALLRHPVFREVCARIYGAHSPVSIFRAMVMNKPAEQGTVLPWHQDGGDVWALDRDPLVTTWVALDRATTANGCVEIIPGSHRLGLLSTYGSTVSEADVARYCPRGVRRAARGRSRPRGVAPQLDAPPLRREPLRHTPSRVHGLLHGWPHPQHVGIPVPDGVGRAPEPRRLRRPARREPRTHAEEYALSLLETNRVLQASLQEATTYARSLEAEIARLRAESDTL